jgi:hypothetical protein
MHQRKISQTPSKDSNKKKFLNNSKINHAMNFLSKLMKATEKIIFGFALVLLLGYLFNQTIHQFEIRSLSSLRGSLITLKGDNDTVRSYHLWCEGPPTKYICVLENLHTGTILTTKILPFKKGDSHHQWCWLSLCYAIQFIKRVGHSL